MSEERKSNKFVREFSRRAKQVFAKYLDVLRLNLASQKMNADETRQRVSEST